YLLGEDQVEASGQEVVKEEEEAEGLCSGFVPGEGRPVGFEDHLGHLQAPPCDQASRQAQRTYSRQVESQSTQATRQREPGRFKMSRGKFNTRVLLAALTVALLGLASFASVASAAPVLDVELTD